MPEKKFTEEDEATTIASVRLAYQDLSIKAKKEEEKLKTLDPAKAKQMERLGMGFNRRGYADFIFLLGSPHFCIPMLKMNNFQHFLSFNTLQKQ